MTLLVDSMSKVLSYDPETGILTWKIDMGQGGRIKAGSEAGCICKNTGYLKITLFKRNNLGHRLAWLLHYRELPDKKIDHINRIRSDNRISNLRLVTNSENGKNRKIHINNSSGHTGVNWSKRYSKWMARVKKGNKRVHLGYFENISDAVFAYEKASKELYPEINGGL